MDVWYTLKDRNQPIKKAQKIPFLRSYSLTQPHLTGANSLITVGMPEGGQRKQMEKSHGGHANTNWHSRTHLHTSCVAWWRRRMADVSMWVFQPQRSPFQSLPAPVVLRCCAGITQPRPRMHHLSAICPAATLQPYGWTHTHTRTQSAHIASLHMPDGGRLFFLFLIGRWAVHWLCVVVRVTKWQTAASWPLLAPIRCSVTPLCVSPLGVLVPVFTLPLCAC